MQRARLLILSTGLPLAVLTTLPALAQWEDQGRDLLGKPAPDFALKDATGKNWKLSDLKGKKVVLLDFGSTGCLPCLDTVRDLQKLHESYNDKPVQIFTICVNGMPLDSLKQWAEYMELTYPILGDLEFKAAEAYGLQVIPFTVIVDHKGVVRWVHTGHPDDYKELVNEQLKALIREVPPAPQKPQEDSQP
ncbi:MAG: peroxiredoxin family protein [Candidatus Zipacnadales bacterium]